MNRITRKDLNDLLHVKSGQRSKRGPACKTFDLSFVGPSEAPSFRGADQDLSLKRTSMGVTSA